MYPAPYGTNMDAEIPDECLNGNHKFGQAGRCKECGIDRVDTSRGWEDRRSGGAGSLTQPLTNGEYQQAKDNLTGR